jgi:hypothetical protein
MSMDSLMRIVRVAHEPCVAVVVVVSCIVFDTGDIA